MSSAFARVVAVSAEWFAPVLSLVGVIITATMALVGIMVVQGRRFRAANSTEHAGNTNRLEALIAGQNAMSTAIQDVRHLLVFHITDARLHPYVPTTDHPTGGSGYGKEPSEDPDDGRQGEHQAEQEAEGQQKGIEEVLSVIQTHTEARTIQLHGRREG